MERFWIVAVLAVGLVALAAACAHAPVADGPGEATNP
jgi:hypothetical protein